MTGLISFIFGLNNVLVRLIDISIYALYECHLYMNLMVRLLPLPSHIHSTKCEKNIIYTTE